ncbi:transcription initiation factor TFIID subunit 4-like [Gouania willdenowi]|uniref:Transcription initiation factor TFIID subunit 4-like n=1 Tax=Gouania willdenowi TaxID=441366 RepID=A0A8C5GWR4_GOUWI|nr:transcription initiation factor TFIID subunit 4-like [Gouania willdenowi]
MMTSNKGVSEGPTQDSCGTAQDGEPSPQVRTLSVPAKCTPIPLHPQPTSAAILKRSSDSSHTIPSAPIFQVPASTGTNVIPAQPVKLVAKAVTPAGVKQAVSFMTPGNQAMPPARTLVISVPKAAASHTAASKQLSASLIIPPGMMLIRSDSGQLMLVSQQALAQVQQAPRILSAQAPRIMAPQVVGVLPQAARAEPSSAVTEQQKHSEIVGPVTSNTKESASSFSQETLESVKKCKSFLITLIKLASSDSRSTTMANSVKELVRNLLEGKMEAEEFTEQLYFDLNATPQPCLVPFLKKSLGTVRRLISDPQLFIQQALSDPNLPTLFSSTDTGQTTKTFQQGVQQPLRPVLPTLVQSRSLSRMVQTGKHLTGGIPIKQPHIRDIPNSNKSTFKDSSRAYREDDDINDVASMAGVNLKEENAQILTSGVGSVVQSCQDQLFLSPHLVLNRIVQTGQRLGVTEVGAEVVALVSHATQEYLRGLLEKVTLMAEHRKVMLKHDQRYAEVSDVRSQFRFLEEVESLKKKKQDEVEKEKLFRLARSRAHREDPLQQQLKQRAKELQLIEEAQLQQREANLTALAAIGPRKKRPIDHTKPQVSLLPRQARVTRVILRDLLLCMEQEPFLCNSLMFYKAML